MSQFEKSDTMLKYAELMHGKGLVKQAWTWRDIVTDLGVGAVIDAAAVGGFAAIKGGIIGAGLVGGTFGSGALSGLAALSVPGIGWALLLGGALTMGIFALTKQMDDNLTDLIDRLGDLDPNERAQPVVDDWIKRLEAFKPVMALAPTTTDVKERAQLTAQKYTSMKELEAYLQAMLQQWPQVKSNLTDWGFDDAQAEYALKKTTTKMTQSVQEAKQRAQTIGQEMIKKMQESSGAGLHRWQITSLLHLIRPRKKVLGPLHKELPEHLKSLFQFLLKTCALVFQ
jgi:hypothetical protein